MVLGLLLMTGQISRGTIAKWLIGILVLNMIIIPFAGKVQEQYGNIGYFVIILVFIIAFLARFNFSRGVLQRVTGGVISGYLTTFLLITGITGLVVVGITKLSGWLGF